MLLTALIFIAVLSVLVFVHELGHFITAKKAGMEVEEFGFGFPPRLFGIKKKGTLYSINAIPLGGFVKIKGENGDALDDPNSFSSKSIWKRMIVISAGVAMNFILAAVLLSIGFMFGLPQAVQGDIPNANISNQHVRVVSLFADSPAEQAGLKVGDVILSVDGQEFSSLEETRSFISDKNREIAVMVERGGENFEYAMTPIEFEEGKTGIGVGLIEAAFVSYPVHMAVVKGVEATAFFTKEIVVAFYHIIADAVTGNGLSQGVSGPVGIAVITGQVARMGLAFLLQFTAILSINLAILNFLPLPALDGGRALFLIIEMIRGKAVNRRIEGLIHSIGFIALILLVLVVTYRDIAQYIVK